MADNVVSPILTSNFEELLDFATVIDEILYGEYESMPFEYDKVFKVEDMKKGAMREWSMVGFGRMPSKAQGTPVQMDSPLSGYTTIYTAVTYGLGFRVTKEMRQDDQHDKIKELPKGLELSARQTIEQVPADLFNYGFVDTYNTGGDGKALFVTNHPRKDGGTEQANRPTVGKDLGKTALQEGLTTIERTVDHRGNKIVVKGSKLIVPPDLRWIAKELLKSPGDAESANLRVNTFKNEDLDYFVWHYLTSAKAWFVQSKRHKAKFKWRQKLQTEPSVDFMTGDYLYKADMRFAVNWSDWIGLYGSPGAG
jgi:hypothetical protein